MAHRDMVALAKFVLLAELQALEIDCGTVGTPHVFHVVFVANSVDFGVATRDSQLSLIFVGQVNIREKANVQIGAAEDNLPISRQGNVVTLNRDTTMAVEEACSGLRMLTAFIIVTAFIAYMVKRSRFQKTFLLLSSIPIAVMCNIIRLCITAVLFMLVSSQAAEKFFHDFAGITMMPAAVLMIFGELWLLKILNTTEPPQEKIIFSSNSIPSDNTQK